MRHVVPLRDDHNGLTEQRSGKPLASRQHHSTPEKMRINRKSQACLPAYTTKGRRAPRLFRPQKSSIAVVRHRSVLGVREDGSRTGSAIFVAKKRRKQPHVNKYPRAQTNNSCVQRSRISQTPRKLPTRISRTYKIPNASPKGMHPREQYKNIPNKNKQLLIPKKYKLPTTLNTTAKDKA